MTISLDLTDRKGLPDPLRVLVTEYPRDLWARDPNFHGLVSFWLDRHMTFRRLLSAMTTATEDVMDKGDPKRFATAISRYGSMFVQDLHGHHQIEDQHYFPILSKKDPRVTRGFDILDKDHHAMDGILSSFVEVANGALQTLDRGPKLIAGAGALHAEIEKLTRLMDRHLTDEEELVVPVILKFGADGLH